MGEEPDTLETACLEREGRTLNEKWTLERLLGVGGVAAVYAARHRNGRRVAIKVLHPEPAVDARMKKRFLREGYVANKVEHPGAVAVLDDAIAEDGSVFLVMELLEGETLEARCRRQGGTLPAADALNLAHALLDVVASAHEGVLHAVAGTGVVAAVLGAVFWQRGKDQHDQALGHCKPSCDGTARDLQDDAKSSITISNIALVGGAVLLGGGAVLFFTAPSSSENVRTGTVGVFGRR